MRLEAFDSMGKLYSHAVPEMYSFLDCAGPRLTLLNSDDRDAHATAHFGWIPQELLHAVALSVEVR